MVVAPPGRVDPPRAKDNWDRIVSIVQIFAGLATPIILALLTYFGTIGSHKNDNAAVIQEKQIDASSGLDTKMVDAALTLLKTTPDGSRDDHERRVWAILVLEQHSKVDEEKVKSLVEQAWPDISTGASTNTISSPSLYPQSASK